MVLAGIPGNPATQTGFGAITYATSPPTGLLGVGLGGDSTPGMIAFQLCLEFWTRYRWPLEALRETNSLRRCDRIEELTWWPERRIVLAASA